MFPERGVFLFNPDVFKALENLVIEFKKHADIYLRKNKFVKKEVKFEYILIKSYVDFQKLMFRMPEDNIKFWFGGHEFIDATQGWDLQRSLLHKCVDKFFDPIELFSMTGSFNEYLKMIKVPPHSLIEWSENAWLAFVIQIVRQYQFHT